MLMYRRIDSSGNKDFVRSTDLPPHLHELKGKIADEEVERLRQQRELEDMVKVWDGMCLTKLNLHLHPF